MIRLKLHAMTESGTQKSGNPHPVQTFGSVLMRHIVNISKDVEQQNRENTETTQNKMIKT